MNTPTMPTDDTSMHGPVKAFPATTWGILSQLRATAPADQRATLHTLCERYWKPVYGVIRWKWAKSSEDAKDLTQAFFLWLLEGDALGKYEKERGSFRRFLKVLLAGFVGHSEQYLQALKRGGRVQTIPIDADSSVAADRLADPRDLDPDRAFDRLWVSQLLQTALERVSAKLARTEREKLFRIYERYELLPAEQRPTYLAVAEEFDLKEGDVRSYLFIVRGMLRTEIRRELAETTRDGETLE